MDNYILNITNEPILEPNSLKWANWFSTADRVVQHTTLPSGVLISTVFLGIDHNFSNSGKPILWETMIFDGPLDETMDRYTSHEDALKGHARYVQLAIESENE